MKPKNEIRACPICGNPLTKRQKMACSYKCAQRFRRGDWERRFWSNVDKTGGENACWIWTKFKNRYGYVNKKGKVSRAHRVAWELTNGIIPEHLYVLHKCDNPPCCNPSHLFLGTQEANVKDMFSKGRQNDRRGVLNGRAKLSPKDVIEIRKLLESGMEQKDIANKYNVEQTSISAIKCRVHWGHI